MSLPLKLWRVSLLVWLLCLSFPVGAASAAFVHMHADAGHDTDHHDGRQIHRHAPADQDHGHDSAPDPAAETDVVIACGPVVAARNPHADSGAAAHPLSNDLSAALPAPEVDGTDDRPHESNAPPDCPDSRPAALRGPPRV